MIFSGSVVVDREHERALRTGRSCLVAIYTGHRPGPPDAEPRVQQRSRPHVDQVRRQPGARSRAEGLPRPQGVLARPVEALGDGGRTARPAQGALLRLVRPQGVGDTRATSGQRVRRVACGSARTCSRCRSTARPERRALGARRRHQPRRARWRLGRPVLRRTLRRHALRRRATRRAAVWVDYGKDFYATITFSDLPPIGRPADLDGVDEQLAYANDEPTVSWRGAQSVPRVLGLRRTPAGLRLVQAPIDGSRPCGIRADRERSSRPRTSRPARTSSSRSPAAPGRRPHFACTTTQARRWSWASRRSRRRCSSTGGKPDPRRDTPPTSAETPDRCGGATGACAHGCCSTGR